MRWAPCVVRGVDRGGLGGESSAWRRCQAPVRGEPHPPRQSQRCAVPPAMGRGGARKRWGDKVQVGGRLPMAGHRIMPATTRHGPPPLRCMRGARGRLDISQGVKRLARLAHWEASPPHSRSLGVTRLRGCVQMDETVAPDRRGHDFGHTHGGRTSPHPDTSRSSCIRHPVYCVKLSKYQRRARGTVEPSLYKL